MNKFISRVSDNWRAGLTVALVSIPLSISLAVASGATPAMGIITAVWAGVLAAIFGGSNFNIVGPAGALSGILAAFSITNGMEALPTLAILSGVFILIAYLLKLERYLILVPATVMHGFSLGVALIIGLNQFNFALGLENLPKHKEFLNNIFESFKNIQQTQLGTFAVFLLFLIGLFLLTKFIKKLPAIIILTPVGILVGYLSVSGNLPFALKTLGQKFPGDSINLLNIPHFVFEPSIIVVAIGVAFVSILETLISAKIADIMTDTKFNARKEMFGLTLANFGSGLFGGLPATGVFVRTGVNVRSGANHKTSAVINAVATAVISIFIFKFFNYIPLAVIASILVFASIRMVELAHLKELWKDARRDFWLAMFTAFVMVISDTVIGLLVGTILALLFFVEKLAKGQFELTTNNASHQMMHRFYEESTDCFSDDCDVIVYSMKGELAYINVEAHTDRLEHKLKSFNTIILRMRELAYIDIEGVHAFDHVVKYLESNGKKVMVSSLTKPVETELEKSATYRSLKEKKLVYPNTRDALRDLGFTNFEAAL